MKLWGLLVLGCLQTGGLYAQTTIEGTITDQKKRPVAGANISIKDSYDGATSDSSGRYRFTTTEQGPRLLVIAALGFKGMELPLNLEGGERKLDYQLKEVVSEMKAVVISAGSFEAGDAKRATVLSSLDVVTTASANADITGALRTLPGAQQVGESEGLFVRGGTANETRVFIDGATVSNFFFTGAPDIATRGRFSPFLFRGTVFSTGGYSALYGQALSSALILESIDMPEQTSSSLGFSFLGGNLGHQYLSKKKNFSAGATYSYFNLWPYFQLVKQTPDYFSAPQVHNADANLRWKTSKTGILKLYTSFQYSILGLRRKDIDSADLKDAFRVNNSYVYTNLSWREKLGKHWKLNMVTSWSMNHDSIRQSLQDASNQDQLIVASPFAEKIFRLENRTQLAQVRAVLERRIAGLSAIRFGGEYQYESDRSRFSNLFSENIPGELTEHYKAGFAEADVYLTNDLALKLGGRVEHSSVLEKSNIVPRLSMAYQVGKGQFSAAYGIFYQKPDKNFLLWNRELDYQKATHYILNYQKISRDYTLRAEVFYKDYGRLVKTFPDTLTNGQGYAKGFDLFWRDRKTIKGLDYWISYSYLDTERDFLNYPSTITPNFAARHTLSVVTKKFVTKWKTGFNTSYTFASGRPYYRFAYDNAEEKFRIADQGRTPAYHNLSFSVNYIPTLGKQNSKSFIVWVLSITNAFGFDQVFNYQYSANGMVKEAIRPPAKRFFFFGCFISLGIDRTEDAINNNL